MKKCIVAGLAALLIVGCGKKKKETETVDYHVMLHGALLEDTSWRKRDTKLAYSFLFDVDGDGVNEVFYVQDNENDGGR
jgi:uncharacterized protein YcfL